MKHGTPVKEILVVDRYTGATHSGTTTSDKVDNGNLMKSKIMENCEHGGVGTATHPVALPSAGFMERGMRTKMTPDAVPTAMQPENMAIALAAPKTCEKAQRLIRNP